MSGHPSALRTRVEVKYDLSNTNKIQIRPFSKIQMQIKNKSSWFRFGIDLIGSDWLRFSICDGRIGSGRFEQHAEKRSKLN